jgi:tRNA(His) guanylyltransferase
MLRFSDAHSFVKPNDVRALDLMDRAARAVMDEYSDVVMGFGESDEYRLGYLDALVYLT